MKTVIWAVYINEIDVAGQHRQAVEIRQRKNPTMMIPYRAAEVASFSDVAGYLKKHSKNNGEFEIHYAKQYNRWNDAEKFFSYGEVIEIKCLEAFGMRGFHLCEECGCGTRSVLDGEAWCSNCQRYQ